MKTLLLTLLIVLLASLPAEAQSPEAGAARLKDVVSVQGTASTPLIGYGLVVGLNKTGDRRQTIFSAQTLANMLERFGIAVAPGEMKIENVAAVLVTAQMSPYAQTGMRVDVTASSIGDARSLQGGTLMPTPLRGPDGAVVAASLRAPSCRRRGRGSRRRAAFCAWRCTSPTSCRPAVWRERSTRSLAAAPPA
jgi:flagellar P-ring protein precursor FlgI